MNRTVKVIFLDFDGVIVSHPDYTKGNLKNIAVLNEIIKQTGAHIVVSSAWRLGR